MQEEELKSKVHDLIMRDGGILDELEEHRMGIVQFLEKHVVGHYFWMVAKIDVHHEVYSYFFEVESIGADHEVVLRSVDVTFTEFDENDGDDYGIQIEERSCYLTDLRLLEEDTWNFVEIPKERFLNELVKAEKAIVKRLSEPIEDMPQYGDKDEE